MKAVVYTDVFQSVVMIGGLLAVLIVVSSTSYPFTLIADLSPIIYIHFNEHTLTLPVSLHWSLQNIFETAFCK